MRSHERVPEELGARIASMEEESLRAVQVVRALQADYRYDSEGHSFGSNPGRQLVGKEVYRACGCA